MTTPSVNDILHDGRPRNATDLNTAYNLFKNWVNDGTYDFNLNSITANTYNNLPGFDITGLEAGETISKGNIVRLKTADGKVWKADSDSLLGVTNILGVSNDAYSTGEVVTTKKDTFTEFTGLVAGTSYYVSTSGAISTTAGKYPLRIGYAQSTTTLILDFFNSDYKQYSNETVSIDNTDSPYTALFDNTIFADASSADVTVALPPAANLPGRVIEIIRTDNTTANAVLITTNAAETISGYDSYSLVYQYEKAQIISDGTNWMFKAPLGTNGVIYEKVYPQLAVAFTGTNGRITDCESSTSDFSLFDQRQIIDPDRVFLKINIEGSAGASTEMQVTIYDDLTSAGNIIFQHNYGVIGNQTGEMRVFEVALNNGNQTSLDLSTGDGLIGINSRGAASTTTWSLYAVQNASPSGSYDIRDITFTLKSF